MADSVGGFGGRTGEEEGAGGGQGGKPVKKGNEARKENAVGGDTECPDHPIPLERVAAVLWANLDVSGTAVFKQLARY